MAQTEDTELRDLVIEALEKNGSLAKIRALLRANIFVAFEDECDNVKQNSNLENILKLPEGILSLSIVHEFLEYCNFNNSLFVYRAESRHGTEYNSESKKALIEKLNLQNEVPNEPVLITLIRLCTQKKEKEQTEKGKPKKDTDNCTYIVEDLQSSATSNSQSDISSDEKNKLHLRLQLDNSDTDTSNDSAKDKVSSEYFPRDHMKNYESENKGISQQTSELLNVKDIKNVQTYIPQVEKSMVYQNIKDINDANSSDSTSYVELKSLNPLDEKLLNTTGVPMNTKMKASQSVSNDLLLKNDYVKSSTLGNTSAVPLKDESVSKEIHQEREKSDVETAEYSYDFSPSPPRKSVDPLKHTEADQSIKNFDYHQNHKDNSNKNSYSGSDHQSSRSSVSISDVADLLSEKSLSISKQYNNDKSVDRTRLSSQNYSRRKSDSYKSKVLSDDSGDFSESPIASLSNLSLDIHSD